MKTKGRFWSKALIAEGFRQTKTIGIAGIISSVLIVLLEMINTTLVAASYYVRSEKLTLFLIILFVAGMMVRLFEFANKRNASDFYDAIPQKSVTIYISYCTVVALWALIMIFAYTIALYLLDVSYSEISMMQYTVEYAWTLIPSMLEDVLYLFAGCVLVIGAMSLGIAMTNTAVTNVVAAVIILMAPRMLVEYFINGYYQLVPFVAENEIAGAILNSNHQIIYNIFSFELDSYALSYIDMGSSFGEILYSLCLGMIYSVAGGIWFCKRKSERIGRLVGKGFGHRFLQITLAYICGLQMIVMVSKCFIHEEGANVNVRYAILWFVISLAVFFLYEFLSTRKWESVLKSWKWALVLIGLYVVTCAGFVASACITSEKVPELSQIDGVKILSSLDKKGQLYYGDSLVSLYHTRGEETSDTVQGVLQQLMLTSQESIVMVQGQLSYEMEKYRKDRDAYDNWCKNLAVPVVISYNGKELARTLHFSEKSCDELMDYMAQEAANTYDYELPMPDLSEEEKEYLYGTLYSFGWDFTDRQIQETYEILREEYGQTKPPLTVFMGKEYNKENVYDFWEGFDMHGNEYALPISLDTPKTLEYIMNTGNQLRSDFDFDWFVEYMTKEVETRGGTLDIILYAGEEKGILYETVSWWGEYVYDIEDERLLKLHKIVSAHNEETVSAEGNILCLVYKNIEGVETSARWYNVTDEEAAQIEELAWMKDKFERYQYWQ